MLQTWEQIKLAIVTLYPQYVGSGKIIDDTDDGTTPSALAILADMVNNRVVHHPYEFEFLKIIGTITLDGSTSYNLRTLFPDLKSVYQQYGINENQEHWFFSNREGNITPLDGYLLRGNSLVFTGTAPTSGTASLQYKSKYAVETSGGTRQQFFLADSNVTLIENANVIIFGIGEFLNWFSDTKEQDRKAEVHSWFKEAFDELILHNKQTNQISSIL